MTTRVLKNQVDPLYARQRGEDQCGHVPEAHVTYDHAQDRYRGSIWCSCRRVTINSTRYREGWAEADRDSKGLLAAAQLLANTQE